MEFIYEIKKTHTKRYYNDESRKSGKVQRNTELPGSFLYFDQNENLILKL